MTALDGRVAIVTGAGRGVGRATARLLANEGAHVVVNDLDAEAGADSVAAITAAGGHAIALAGDITDTSLAERLVHGAVETFGGLDILVNNAGYVWNGAMHNHSDEQWQAMFDVHVTAPFRLLRAFAPWLREQVRRERGEPGGPRCRKVVNVSSLSGTRGAATQVGYASAKAAVTGLTRTLAKEWGRYNVCVNCVAFGHIETRLTQPYPDTPPSIRVAGRDYRVGLSEAQLDAVRQSTPLGRPGRPEDAAGAIYLFCIPHSDYVTGEVLTCSGGA